MTALWVFAHMWGLSEAARSEGTFEALQAASGFHCQARNGFEEVNGPLKGKCRCFSGSLANSHCAEAGQEQFSLSMDMSSQCKCERHDCYKKYDVSNQKWENGQWMCQCNDELFAHALCGVPWGSKAAFPLRSAKEGCTCLDAWLLQMERPDTPVRVAALNLCTAFWKQIFSHPQARRAPDLTSEMCQQVVAEGLLPPGQRWLEGIQDAKETHRGQGRLDPLAPMLPDTAVHHHLQNVCKDECKELVQKLQEQKVRRIIHHDIDKEGASYAEACADRVVRQVESDILGCCARSCGYNGRSCLAWPFFNKTEKVIWLEECCTEHNVLSGSPREAMCNSVLSPEQAKKVSATDIKVKKGVDVGSPYIGQGPLLLWTEEGVKSELGKYYAQSQQPPRPNEPVSSQVMEEHPGIWAEGLENGTFKEKNFTASGSESQATSVMEASRGLEECDLKQMKQCTATFQDLKAKSCMKQRKWKVSEKVQAKDAAYGDPGCPKDKGKEVETPADCIEAFKTLSNVKSYFFEFDFKNNGEPLNPDSPSTPINCYVETEQSRCDDGFPKEEKKWIKDRNAEDPLNKCTFWLAAEDVADALPAKGT